MNLDRRCVLSIAGFDPCGGAGLLADVRTIESYGVRALAASTAITFQHDGECCGVNWLSLACIEAQLDPLYRHYEIAALKVGLIENLSVLCSLLRTFKKLYPNAPIVWDPIVAASSGYVFHREFLPDELHAVLDLVMVITPNQQEILKLGATDDALAAAREFSRKCAVILKGGHAEGRMSEDVLFLEETESRFAVERLPGSGRHGSGCVFSAALAARLALGDDILDAGRLAQGQVVKYLTAGIKSAGGFDARQ